MLMNCPTNNKDPDLTEKLTVGPCMAVVYDYFCCHRVINKLLKKPLDWRTE